MKFSPQPARVASIRYRFEFLGLERLMALPTEHQGAK
jgi:hypothetical protein